MRLSPQAEFLRTGQQVRTPRPDIRRRRSPTASADVSVAGSTVTSRRLRGHAHSLASSQLRANVCVHAVSRSRRSKWDFGLSARAIALVRLPQSVVERKAVTAIGSGPCERPSSLLPVFFSDACGRVRIKSYERESYVVGGASWKERRLALPAPA